MLLQMPWYQDDQIYSNSDVKNTFFYSKHNCVYLKLLQVPCFRYGKTVSHAC